MPAFARETNLLETTFVLPRDPAIEREQGIREAASVRENGKRIAFKTARSENVDLDEAVFAFAR